MSKDGLSPPDSFPLGKISPAEFLSDYWQKKPCLLRGVWPGIENTLPIDGDELAGIASDANVEARLISGTFKAADWAVDYGPFSAQDYSSKGDENWTLLVQDVEKHYPPLKNWLNSFSFLPSWRIDDIMVSFAAPGGSVGPHTDQYDVFLFQASGRRRWQWATDFDPTLLANEEIKVLKKFAAETSWELKAGDLLYLPPNIAHYGVALDSCLTYSVGLRAPSKAELFASLAEWYAHDEQQGGRFSDTDLELKNGHNGEVDTSSLQRVKSLLSSSFPEPIATQDSQFSDWFCQFISSYRLSGSPPAATKPLTPAQLLALLKIQPLALVRNPWSRFCWRPEAQVARLYATGMQTNCSVALAEAICTPGDVLDLTALGVELNDLDRLALTELFNQGHLLENND